ncbi:creatininase family protein [Thermatribacter velox]|uniref:Creatininase family protein n=1 Tax=Thermatribacter velox TaxID=3039681 RepID=A0ABZ2YFF3_9BACT
MEKKVFHPEMNYSDFKENHFDKVILAVGSAENHGFHLPFGTDTLVAQALAMEVAKRVEGVLVLPPVPYGVSFHYQDFPFTLTLRPETLIEVLKDVLTSTIEQGINRIIIINGHDGNIAPLEVASRTIKVKYPDAVIAVLDAWWVKAGELLPKDTFEVWGGLGHAGEGESSIMLFLYPQFCRMENARGVVPELPEGPDIKWKFNELTPYGATGDPTKATAEKGQKMFEVLVDYVVSFIREMDREGWKYGLKKKI